VGQAVIDELTATGHDVWNLSGHSAELALEHTRRAVANGLDALIVVGGDGMVHLAIQAVGGTDIPCGIVAMGTGNDFATTLGLPVHETSVAVAALEAAMERGDDGIRAVDLIQVTGLGLTETDPVEAPSVSGAHWKAQAGARNTPVTDAASDPAVLAHVAAESLVETPPIRGTRWVAGAVSAGLDAAVNARANAMLRPRGSSRYVIAALRELAAYRAWPYKLTIEHVKADDATIAHLMEFPGMANLGPEEDGIGLRFSWVAPGAMVTAANSPRIGGGILVAPQARVDDGYLDLVIAGDIHKSGAAKMFPQMMSGGKHADSKDVRIIQAKAVRIEAGRGATHIPAAYADGEFLGTLPLRAQLRAGALKVLVPQLA